MKGCTKSGSSVASMFSMLLCTAVSVQLREPVMSSRPSITANLWCMYTEPTSHRTQIPGEQSVDMEEMWEWKYQILQCLIRNVFISSCIYCDVYKRTRKIKEKLLRLKYDVRWAVFTGLKCMKLSLFILYFGASLSPRCQFNTSIPGFVTNTCPPEGLLYILP